MDDLVIMVSTGQFGVFCFYKEEYLQSASVVGLHPIPGKRTMWQVAKHEYEKHIKSAVSNSGSYDLCDCLSAGSATGFASKRP